jgi:beta-glucosidase
LIAVAWAIACGQVAGGSGDNGAPPDGGTGETEATTGSGGDAAEEMPMEAAAASDGLQEGATYDPDTPAVESRVKTLLAQMTLDEKVAQMVMVDYAAMGLPGDVTSDSLGAVLANGDEAPGNNGPQDWLSLANTFRGAAAATRLKIPLIFGVDAVHGNAKVAGATVFPHGIGLGCTHDPALIGQIERATAAEVLAMGLSMSFSPDSDVGQDERWGRTYESFAEDPTLVSQLVTAAVNGYQYPNLGAPGSLLACAKHALGAGETAWGTGVDGGIDEGDSQITEAQMRAVHLPPFKAAIDAGVMSIMVSFSSWNGTHMSASSKWLTGVIKGELGFKGLLLSDYNAIRQLSGDGPAQEAAAINAGLDMIMMSDGHAAFIADIKSLVGSGTIPQARIDDAVTRILRTKVIAGLFDMAAPDASAVSTVGSAAHRQIARQAVRESLVLLKNANNVLPLSKSAHIHIAGPGANDVGVQSGGWTLGWQGVTQGKAAGIGGTTILTGMQQAATSSSLVTYSWDGNTVPAGASIGVVVLYENPYAEFEGDTNDPTFSNTASANIYDGLATQIVPNMEKANIPLVLVLVTGRPIRIESYLPHFAAVVAAWLPGSEGEGVADVLYGDAKFTGTLSKSWPKDATTLPLSSLQSGANPLFAYGFGCQTGQACP